MTGSIRGLPCKNQNLNPSSRAQVKKLSLGLTLNPTSGGSGDKQILGASWPASSVYSASEGLYLTKTK